jgi:hypothetical protein
MELEKLKEMLNQSAASDNEVSATSLEKILSTKSKSVVGKMKRNLMIELSLMILLYGYVILKYFNNMTAISWLLGGIELIFLIYFIIKHRLLNRLECPSCKIQCNLTKQLNALERLLRFYLWIGVLLIPMTALGSFWIGYAYYSYPGGLPKELSFLLLTSAIILAATLLLCIPLYFFTKWYIRKLYGAHIEKLKMMMNELNEEVAINP